MDLRTDFRFQAQVGEANPSASQLLSERRSHVDRHTEHAGVDHRQKLARPSRG